MRGTVIAVMAGSAVAGEPQPITLPAFSVAVSPDGARIVFSWRDDLWSAASDGGVAERLTSARGRELMPMFLPDGRRIVFCGEGSGVRQVYEMPAGGGAARQLTHHSEGASLEAVAPDGSFLLVRGPRDGCGYDDDRLIEVRLDGEAPERVLFDDAARWASVSPDGGRVLFCRGGEQLFRRGYRGPRASRIWMFERASGVFAPVVCDEVEARWPLWLPDGKSYLFTSERDGSFNLWRGSIDGGEAVQLTRLTGRGLLYPSLSADGRTVVFRTEFGVWRFRPGMDEEPVRVDLHHVGGLADTGREPRTVRRTVDADVAPDGVTTVFSAEGDLWSAAGGGLSRLTETWQREGDVAFLPDGSGFYHLLDDGVEANYRFARRIDRERGWTPDNLELRPVTAGAAFKRRLRPSPDGRRIAWIEGNGRLMVAAADGTHAACVFECWDPPTFDWSPDGNSLVLAAQDRNFNREILLLRLDDVGVAGPVNISRHPGFDGSPRWSPDGRRIVFLRRRGGGERELFCFEIGAAGLGSRDLEALADPFAIATRGIEPSRLIWSADSSRVLFQSSRESNDTLYAVEAKSGGKVETLARQRGTPLRMDPDGVLHWLVDGQPATLRDGRIERRGIPPTEVMRDRPAHNRLSFRMIWRTLGMRFYDPSLNGLDWQAKLAEYEPHAVASPDWRSFDWIVGMLMGELNASHLTFVSKPWPGGFEPPERKTITRHPGLRLETSADGMELRIGSVLPGSPAAAIVPPLRGGSMLVAIDGHPVTGRTPLVPLLEGESGSQVRLTVDEDGARRTVGVATISFARARELAGQARLAARREVVARRGDGRVGYLSLPRMQRSLFEEFERAVYAASLERDGLILDLRDNGGGTIADQLLTMFCQPRHAVTIPRDGGAGYPQDRMVFATFAKPMVVLINENTFSNAEVFAHAVKRLGRARLVGVQTAGGVISSGHDRILDAGTLRVPFRGWFHPDSGEDLEMNGALPDIPVDLPPGPVVRGEDPQLDAALGDLLGQLDGPGQPGFVPRYRSRVGGTSRGERDGG